MAEIDKLIKADKENKLVKGFKESIHVLKLGQAAEVFVTKTCPSEMKRQLKEAAELAKAKIIELNVSSEELSAQLKKPFSITVAAIMQSK